MIFMANVTPKEMGDFMETGIETERVWMDFSGRVRSFVMKRVNDEVDAEDIIQEIVLKIHSNLHALRESGKILPWIYSVSRNAISDHYRKKRAPEYHYEDILRIASGKIDKKQDRPEDISAEIRRCLEPLMEAMPAKYREAILADMSSISQAEYAGKSGLSISGAKSRIQRARKMLRQSLFDCCDFALDKYGNVLDYQRKDNGCGSC